MQQMTVRGMILALLALTLAACGGEAEPTSTPVPTFTPIGFVDESLNQAEETETLTINSPTPEASPTPDPIIRTQAAQTLQARDQLPPTWTAVPSRTPRPTEENAAPAFQLPTSTPRPTDRAMPNAELCAFFRPDPERTRDFSYSTLEFTVYWQRLPLEGYIYHFKLLDPDGEIVLDSFLEDRDSYQIRENVITRFDETYSWEVQPMLGLTEVCRRLTGEIFIEELR